MGAQGYVDGSKWLAPKDWEPENGTMSLDFGGAPLDGWDVDRIGINDDSPLNISLENGHIQQPCERWLFGGPEDLGATLMCESCAL